MSAVVTTPCGSVKKIRAILFDKDGTLVDFNRTWFAISCELARRSAAGDDTLARSLLEAGGYDWESERFRANSAIAAGTIEDIVALWHPHDSAEQRRERVAEYDIYGVEEGAKQAVAVEALTQTLQALRKAGFVLGIATNDSEAGARATAAALGISDLFSGFVGYDTAARAKPHADPLLHFAAEIGVTPAEVAMVGDNPHDLECARAAKAGLAVGVLTGNSPREVLEPLADIVLDSIADLPDYLAGQ
ncbi:HAD family hydrolase [Pseudochrobactrum sp. HB0163]|uniref:HAD family hydrolase n=1 Tax=Pseudochrobactrum sp. HB0163 TaxID=3450708 RepID=UPI003F6E284A